MTKLCNVSDLPENGKDIFTVDGTDVLVIQTGEQLFAVSNICPHAGGKLNKGRVDDGTITCIEHGVCFDLNTGAVRLDEMDEDLLEMIDADNLPFGPLKIYKTTIENGTLYLCD
jgi:nitrite reductase/ring-hydroxylating ferredoxin subunit